MDLSNRAYTHLYNKLANRELVAGQKVSEYSLARELGISRTPVRHAIGRLISEGLFIQVPCSGTFVVEPNRLQIIEMYQVRMALEVMAVELSVSRMHLTAIRGLQECVAKMRKAAHDFRDSGEEYMDNDLQEAFLNADMEFHDIFLREARNETAAKIVGDSNLRRRAFGPTSHNRGLAHVSQILLQHGRILAAVRRRNIDAAMRLMKRHIQFSMDEALLAFDLRQ